MEQAHTQLIAQLNERILARITRRFILSLPKR